MNLYGLYIFMKNVQRAIGDDCSVTFTVIQDLSLRIRFSWKIGSAEEDEAGTTRTLIFCEVIGAHELESVKNWDGYIEYLCKKANREYKLKTVGEE